MINPADFLKWLEVFNVTSGGAAASGTVSPGLINQLGVYAANGDVISGLATANDGTLITSAAGVPSISSTLPIAVQDNITALGTIGESVLVTLSADATTRLSITNASTGTSAIASSQLTNNAASASFNLYSSTYTPVPSFASRLLIGVDSGITNGILMRAPAGGFTVTTDGSLSTANLFVNASGNTVLSGSLTTSQTAGIIGTTTNNNANAGSVGEYIEGTVLLGSAIPLTANTNANITSILLGAGDWDVEGNVGLTWPIATVIIYAMGWVSSSSASIPDAARYNVQPYWDSSGIPVSDRSSGFSTPSRRFSLTTTTTIYLSVRASFTTSTCTAYGRISARRVR